jgi:hypothetical protein
MGSHRKIAWLCLGAFALLTVLIYGPFVYDATRALYEARPQPILLDRDFANYWVGGHAALDGEQRILFEQSIYYAHLQRIFGAGVPIRNWSYPPHFLLFLWPLGFLGYKAGLLAFLGATCALFLAAVAVFRKRFAAQSSLTLLGLAVVPYVLLMIYSTQNGFLTGAALLLGLAWMRDRPILAGLAFACLTVKPQLGLMIPVLLIMDRNWRALASAAVFTVCLIALSAAVFGLDVWQRYFTQTLDEQVIVMTQWHGGFLLMMPTVFGGVRSLGFTAALATILQLPVSIAAFLAVVWLLRKETDGLRRTFITLCGTFLATPYAFNYDMAALGVVAALQVGSDRIPNARGAVMVISLIAALGPFILHLGRSHVPLSPLILAAGLVVIAWEVRRLRSTAGIGAA